MSKQDEIDQLYNQCRDAINLPAPNIFKVKEMTNLEIMAHIIKTVTNPESEYSNGQDAIGWATQFLDEAEKRAHDLGVLKGQKMGLYQAQYDMRERAAKLFEDWKADAKNIEDTKSAEIVTKLLQYQGSKLAAHIRALPVEE